MAADIDSRTNAEVQGFRASQIFTEHLSIV